MNAPGAILHTGHLGIDPENPPEGAQVYSLGDRDEVDHYLVVELLEEGYEGHQAEERALVQMGKGVETVEALGVPVRITYKSTQGNLVGKEGTLDAISRGATDQPWQAWVVEDEAYGGRDLEISRRGTVVNNDSGRKMGYDAFITPQEVWTQ